MRSTQRAPDFLSNSYLTGSPPTGTSMMTLTLSGGLSPMGIRSMFIMGRPYSPDDGSGEGLFFAGAAKSRTANGSLFRRHPGESRGPGTPSAATLPGRG